MAPKKRPATTSATKVLPPPNVLVEEALADLRYLEPKRTRDRVVACFNEAFLRIQALEQLHQEPTAKPRRRLRGVG